MNNTNGSDRRLSLRLHIGTLLIDDPDHVRDAAWAIIARQLAKVDFDCDAAEEIIYAVRRRADELSHIFHGRERVNRC